MNTLDDLASAWQAAKSAERAANAERLAVEAEILKAMSDIKDEGTTTEATDTHRVSVTTKLTRSLDEQVLKTIWQQLPRETTDRLFRLKPHLVLKELRYIQLNDAPAYRMASRAIVTKPSKPTIKIEDI